MSFKTRFKIDYTDESTYTIDSDLSTTGEPNFTKYELFVLLNRCRYFLRNINSEYYPEIEYKNDLVKKTTELYINIKDFNGNISMDTTNLEQFVAESNLCVIYDTDLSFIPKRYFHDLSIPKITFGNLNEQNPEKDLIEKQLDLEKSVLQKKNFLDKQNQINNYGYFKYKIGFNRLVWYNVYSALSGIDFVITDGFVVLFNNGNTIDAEDKIQAAVSNEKTEVNEILKEQGYYSYKTCDQYRPLVILDKEPKTIDYTKERTVLNGNKNMVFELLKKFTGKDHILIGNTDIYSKDDIFKCQLESIKNLLKLEMNGNYFLTLDPLIYLIYPEVINIKSCFFYKSDSRDPEFENSIDNKLRNLNRDHFAIEIDNVIFYDNLIDEICEMWDFEIILKVENYVIIKTKDINFDSEWFELALINIRLKRLPSTMIGSKIYTYSSKKALMSGIEFNGEFTVHGELLATPLGNKVYYDILDNDSRFELGIFDRSMPVEKLWRSGYFFNDWAKAYYRQTGKISGYFKN